VYYYYLQALASRVVEGTIVADTDAGWFTWIQAPVQLTRTTYTSSSPEVKYSWHVAESPELSVIFPAPVAIRHVWVATARTSGDPFFGWDAHGTVSCEPMDYATGNYPNKSTVRRTPQTGDETPAPAPPAAKAVTSAPPFPPTSCTKPFVSATVTRAVQPEFPNIVRDEGFGGDAIAEVAIALDAQGKLVDAWMWARTGYDPLDQAALKAARRSSYSGAISYCRPVSGMYLFRADFISP
jgi:hypothetical protein